LLKLLAKSIREYKTASILSPLFVIMEVVLECLIPLVIVWLGDAIKNGVTMWVSTGATIKTLGIGQYAIILLAMAFASLACGALAGAFCAKASAGFAKNLRKDLYYKVQEFSFENVDKFSTSSLVTRMTTDVTNVQFSYMMIVRMAFVPLSRHADFFRRDGVYHRRIACLDIHCGHSAVDADFNSDHV